MGLAITDGTFDAWKQWNKYDIILYAVFQALLWAVHVLAWPHITCFISAQPVLWANWIPQVIESGFSYPYLFHHWVYGSD